MEGVDKKPRENSRWGIWRTALLFAVPISALLLGLYYYWFSVADRYILFLYYHDMGPIGPDTDPFSRVTSSRYWMTGLVAAGIVMTAYAAVNFLFGRFKSNYRPPRWWRAWLLCFIPLLVGIPAITLTQNQPPLPWNLVILTTLAVLVGLGLALMPGQMAAQDPEELILLAIDGFGLMFFMLVLVGIEEIGRWVVRGSAGYILMMFAGLAAGVFTLAVASAARTVRQRPGQWQELFLGGLCISYLLMPAIHFFSNGYFYISDSDNFFARNGLLQLLIWLVAGLAAFGITHFREWSIEQWYG